MTVDAGTLDRIRQRPGQYELFQAMRLIELAHPHLPRLGDALRPQDEPIRFAQEASLTFAPNAITALEPGVPARLVQRVFGMLGPNGALPIHMTEYARERMLYEGDRTFLRFLDMLLHRFGLLFYKAWSRTQPAVSLDRANQTAFLRYLGAMFGMVEPALRERDALGDASKFHFTGRLSRTIRDADGLQAWIQLRYNVPMRVEQFCAHWMDLDPRDRTRLHGDIRSCLGRGAILGKSVWDVQHKFRIVVGPLDWQRYVELLPGGTALAQLQAMVRQYVGFEFNWDLQLILRREDVPSWSLGSQRQIGRLGRTSWLNGGPDFRRRRDADDLVMNVESILPLRVTHPSTRATTATQ
ncbi:MAG: type VI secretion system baseplate subunit TssG [Aquabacterium sp.]